MNIDSTGQDRQTGPDRLNELERRLAERKAELDEREAKLYRFDKRLTELEALAQRVNQGKAAAPVSPSRQETPTPRTFRYVPASEVLYILMFVALLAESVLNFFGERTQWTLLKAGGVVVGLLAVGAATVTWLRGKRAL